MRNRSIIVIALIWPCLLFSHPPRALAAGSTIIPNPNRVRYDVTFQPTIPGRRFQVETISQNVTCTSLRVIPASVKLRFVNGARLIKKANCMIKFQGFGLDNPESVVPIFSGLEPGDVVWTGTEYPSTVTTSLWDNTDLSDKLLRAIAALAGKHATIKTYPGNFGFGWQLSSGQSLYLTRGTYTNSINMPDSIEFYLESNTSVYGDGKDATILQESSKGGRNVRMFGPSGFKEGPFAGYNEKINIHDLAIIGHPSQVFYDNGPTTVMLGNCTDCHAQRVRLKDTHAYGIYIGGFRSLGFVAKDSSIEYCEFDHVIAQNSGALNGINIRIQHNRYWNLGKLATDPLSNAVDIEPNVEDEITQNISVCDNYIDGRGAKQYFNGIVVQAGGSMHGIIQGEVCRNTIIGRDYDNPTPGILLNGIMISGGYQIQVFDNSVSGGVQSGLYLSNNRSLDIRDNKFIGVAGGGIDAIRVESVADSTFTNNTIEKRIAAENDRVAEMPTRTKASAKGRTITTNSIVYPFWKGLTVSIAGRDFVVEAQVDYSHFLTTTPIGDLRNAELVTKFGNNVYAGNKRGSIVLSNGSRESSKK